MSKEKLFLKEDIFIFLFFVLCIILAFYFASKDKRIKDEIHLHNKVEIHYPNLKHEPAKLCGDTALVFGDRHTGIKSHYIIVKKPY